MSCRFPSVACSSVLSDQGMAVYSVLSQSAQLAFITLSGTFQFSKLGTHRWAESWCSFRCNLQTFETHPVKQLWAHQWKGSPSLTQVQILHSRLGPEIYLKLTDGINSWPGKLASYAESKFGSITYLSPVIDASSFWTLTAAFWFIFKITVK